MTVERRQHFRLVYPIRARPRLETALGTFPVTDLSESGLCVRAPAGVTLEVGAELHGTLRLPERRGEVAIRAHVVRHAEDGALALHLDPRCELPLALMMEEQRWLIRKGVLKP